MKKLLFLKIFILVFSGLQGQQQSPEYIIFKKDTILFFLIPSEIY